MPSLSASRREIRWKTNSQLHAPYAASAEKVSYSGVTGKKQIAPTAHKSGWDEPGQESFLWQAGLRTVHSGRDAS